MKKFKKLIALVTVLLFALSIFAPAWAQDETTTTTEEQTTGSVYDDAAKILKDKGIMVGNESGDLMLDKSLTRAEILKMILLSTGQGDVVNDYVYAEQSFTDVPKDHWAFAYVEAGKDLGIVNGYPNGTFKPDQPVKFEELCKMLVAAKGESPDAGKWPVNYVRKALDLGFFSGIEDEVGIGDVVIRGQAAVAFANAFFPPEKSIVVKDVYSVANDSIKVAVDVYLNGETATLEDGDILPMDFEIKDASDPTKTLAVTAIDSNASDFANGILVLKTAAQTAGANYKVFFKGQDTGKTFAGVALPLQVTKVEALNYKEIKVTFNRAVDNATYATTAGNYTVKIANSTISVSNVSLASDNKSVTLLLSTDFKNYKNYSLTVTVSKAVGLDADYTGTIAPFLDTTAPQVVDVKPIGTMRLLVTFSEPVKNASVQTNYVIDGSYMVAEPPTADSTAKVYNLRLYSPLATTTTHTIEFKGITDYADFNLVTPLKTFSVTTDTTALAAPTVLSATQTSVKLKFNKGIASIVSVSGSPAAVNYTGATFDTDPSVVTLNFDKSGPIPASGDVLTLSVTDISGVTTSGLTVTVIPTVDITRPAVVSCSVDSQTTSSTTLLVEFTENVVQPPIDASYFTLKNSSGVLFAPTAVAYPDSNTKNKLKVTFGVKDPGTYTLLIDKVIDDSPLQNPIIPTSVTVSITDKIAPYVVSNGVIYDPSNKIIYVVFSEPVDTATALNAANYVGIKSDNTLLSLSSAILSMVDSKTVKLDLSVAGTDISALASLQVSNIKDLAGNTITSAIVGATSLNSNASAQITKAELTAKNTIKLTITGNLVSASQLTPNDFVVSKVYGTLNKDYTVTLATTDGATITLTLQQELVSDATYDGTVGHDVYVGLVQSPITKDIYGKSITIADANGLKLIDSVKPTVTISTGDSSGQIKLTFSEYIVADNVYKTSDTVDNSAIRIYDSNGTKVTTWNASWSDLRSDLYAKTLVISGLTGGSIYKVYIDASRVVDRNNNVMAPIDAVQVNAKQ